MRHFGLYTRFSFFPLAALTTEALAAVTLRGELLVFGDWLQVICLLKVDLDFVSIEWACFVLVIMILGTTALTGLTAVTYTGLDLDKGVIDSGCSWHMTWNMSYLSDFQELNGGYFAFGGNLKGGKISGKGKIKTEDYLLKFLQMILPVLLVRRANNKEPLAEAVNIACYVQKRVLVTKPHNKTLYELLHGRTPSIGFMRPFGCPVTILNTLDPLGKFKGNVDEGFLVGYSVNSKAFRVFNSRTRIVQETLHVNFLENKLNIAGTSPTWLFDIDS
nr:retrovirus-related Pol polyprotein from transposon TNT 1-94 [Tanacetum cinerariifolium]